MKFVNAYEDEQRASAYARLEFAGTYYIAFRDLPEIISKQVAGKKGMDFGCGAGRSTRFLAKLGFEVIGVDISEDMLRQAHEIDPGGDYRPINDGDFSEFAENSFDLIFAAFPFDNIPTSDKKVSIFKELRRILNTDGRIVNLVSSPEIYTHEWITFSSKDFPENMKAKCGDVVKIITLDIDDKRPVEDIIWPDEDYRRVYADSGLAVVQMHKPLGREDEPYRWVNETRIAPWVIYVLGKIS